MPTDEVANLENLQRFSFNRKKKQIVRQTHKKRKFNIDQDVLITTETTMLDSIEVDIIGLAFVGVAFSQANVSSVSDMAKEMKKYKAQVEILENHVDYKKENEHNITKFIEYTLEL
jgi:hypothetical protein